jgi:hypothetical protein
MTLKPCLRHGVLLLQLGHPLLRSPVELAVRVALAFEYAHEVVHAFVEFGQPPADRRLGLEVLGTNEVVRGGHAGLSKGESIGSENVAVEEPRYALDQFILPDPDSGRMLIRHDTVAGLAVGVCRAVPVGVAMHTALAGRTPHVRPQLVRVLRLGMRVGRHDIEVGTMPLPPRPDSAPRHEFLGSEEGCDVNQGFMGWNSRDDPLILGVVLARVTFVLGSPPVPHHEARVLGICENLPHSTRGPVPDCSLRVNRLRRRPGFQVLVEDPGDGPVGQQVLHPQVEDLRYRLPAGRVRCQLRLVLALCPLRGHRVLDLLSDVSVAGLADVEPLIGVYLDAVAGLFQHLQHVPLSYALLRSPQEGQGGVSFDLACPARANDRLVCGDQRDAQLLQIVLDLRALV